ncbi:hypothetical protein [Acidocella aminolytica]|uniref:Uncharacterized protein n=1 Tax=Acidocella aminolytica 101 = DSM 11237 TaxID=1120923 RepID=A0A0D6PF75_9PROT|nr:hypothetical protein [Acidocella aminolytica]GAN80011.1 hypothetical protein Aam_035_018 [Acidocella aminolytica 101 = DSM 11237]
MEVSLKLGGMKLPVEAVSSGEAEADTNWSAGRAAGTGLGLSVLRLLNTDPPWWLIATDVRRSTR